jgi:hypothetical protein
MNIKLINMKTKLYTLIIFSFFGLIFLSAGTAYACDTCQVPCPQCPPNESVPLDGGLGLILLGAAALGAKKVFRSEGLKSGRTSL